MRWLLLLNFCSLVWGQKPFYFYYESASVSMKIENDTLHLIHRIYHYDPNIPSSVPKSVEKRYYKRYVSPKEQRRLIQQLLVLKFWDWKDSYGAPEGQRYYPYYFHVRWKKQEKEVIYRSNPMYPPPPPNFTKLEEYIHKYFISPFLDKEH